MDLGGIGYVSHIAKAINASGATVGDASGTSGPTPSFLAISFDPPTILYLQPDHPFDVAIQANTINDAGVPAGFGSHDFLQAVFAGPGGWLPLLPNGLNQHGGYINNAAEVVGTTYFDPSNQTPGHATLWLPGASGYSAVDLGTFDGHTIEPLGLAPNRSDGSRIIVGRYSSSTFNGYTALIWQGGTWIELPAPPNCDLNYTEARDVSDTGIAVGVENHCGYGAVLWEGATFRSLDPECVALGLGGGSGARGIAVTPSGRILVVGTCAGQPAVWFDNGPCGFQAQVLPVLAGHTEGEALDVNASGQIVGYTRASAGAPAHAVRWGFAAPPLSSTCPSLELSKQAAQANVLAGTRIVFTLSVTNTGPGTAQAVVLSDVLPTGPGLSWLIDTQGPGTPCAISAGTVTCALGDLASGASFSVSVGTGTSTSSCGRHDNTASATATNRSPAWASASVTVDCVQENFGGCTPGFWKQSKHFAYWTPPFTPTTLIGGVFTGAGGYHTAKENTPIGGQALLQGLSFQGGSSLGGAAEILVRAGIAAVLNAANPNVNYARLTSDVIAGVNDALASGDRTAILTLAHALDADNNRQCTVK